MFKIYKNQKQFKIDEIKSKKNSIMKTVFEKTQSARIIKQKTKNNKQQTKI